MQKRERRKGGRKETANWHHNRVRAKVQILSHLNLKAGMDFISFNNWC